MNIFSKTALQSMRKSRTRTAVTIAGVALSAAMITAVATFAVSLQNYMINGAAAKYGDWHVAFHDVSSTFAEERSHDPEAADTAIFENIGYAMLEGGKNPEKPYLFIAGFNEDAFASLPVRLVSGRLPETAGEILVPAHVAANGGVNISLGDTLTLAVGDRLCADEILSQHDPYTLENGTENPPEILVPKAGKIYTVVGICERPAFEEYTAPGYTLITAAGQKDRPDRSSVFVTLKNPRKVHAYVDRISGITREKPSGNPGGTQERSLNRGLDYSLNDDVLRFMGLSGDRIFNTLLYSTGGILAAIIMLGSIFLIYNSFTISLSDRMRQFGILLSVGATEKQLRNSVLFEGLCIGIIGIPIGIMLGIPSIHFVISLVSRNFRNIMYDTVPLTLTISVPALCAAAALSLAAILISAYIPAKKAFATPVMECIRQTNEIKLEGKDVKTSRFAERLYGLEGVLALKNFRRNKRRYRSIVLSLTLSVVLFVSSNTFGIHLKQAAEHSVVSSDYDICFYSDSIDEAEMFTLYDRLKTADGVYESSYQAISTFSCSVNADDLSDVYRQSAGSLPADGPVDLLMDIQFVEDSVYLHFLESLSLPAGAYTGAHAKMTAVAKAKKAESGDSRKHSLIDMFAERSMNIRITPPASDVSLAVPEQNLNITFVDTIPSDTLPKPPSEAKPYVFTVVAPYQMKKQFETPGVHTVLGLTFRSENPSRSVEEMKTMIQGAGITSGYTLYNVYGMLDQNRNVLFIVNLFTYVFVVMISLIATANVFNTISTNIRLRRRELAMLRSVGMSDRDFNKMMGFECIFYGMRTLLLSFPAAGILSFLIYKGLSAGGADIDFIFPWASIGISAAGVFLVIFITTLYAVSKIRKENIIDALRDDMT